MRRDEAITLLRAARKNLQESIAGLTEADFTRPSAVKKRTIKDVLAYLAAWDEETVRVLQAFSMQAEPLYAYAMSDRNDFAAWNEEQVAQRREHSFIQVLAEFESARRDLIQVLEGLTDQVLNRNKRTPWGTTQTGFDLVLMQIERDREQATQIRSYRKKLDRWARARQKYTEKRRTTKKP